VTITHTAGVFALGLVTLFAQYVVAERLFPILSFVSGGIVATIGFSPLCVVTHRAPQSRVRATNEYDQNTRTVMLIAYKNTHMTTFITTIMHTSIRTQSCSWSPHEHSHARTLTLTSTAGSRWHPVTWRNLLASAGGLLPCPSALVVLLSAIALHRVDTVVAVVASASRVGSNAYRYRTAFVYTGVSCNVRDQSD